MELKIQQLSQKERNNSFFPVFTSVSNTGPVITAVTIATPVGLGAQQQCLHGCSNAEKERNKTENSLSLLRNNQPHTD